MCGIAGILEHKSAYRLVMSMLDILKHRGPDAVGLYRNNIGSKPIVLGHHRLSIIDLTDAANQPLRKDGLVIIFNGEIYNYMELFDELDAQGVQFETQSDTEVLLEAWRKWGPACLTKLRGMFAFALYDEINQRLFLARDPFGIKPLFYTQQGCNIAFASELKALLPVLEKRDIDYSGLVASLMYVWVPETHCCIRGVKKFPPGYWAECFPDGRMKMHQYWDARKVLAQGEISSLSVGDLRKVIEASIEAHMIADVPVSTFLSGGLDSSIITAVAARKISLYNCYTISFRKRDKAFEAMPDDVLYARKLANFLDLKLHEIEIAPDVATMLPEIVRIVDEPVGDAAAINTYLICQGAREAGVKVLLSGMGADELFAGYRKYYACILAQWYRRLPGLIRYGIIEPTVNFLPVAGDNAGYRTIRWAKRFISFANLPEEAAFRRSYTYYDIADLKLLLERSLWPCIDELLEEHREIYVSSATQDIVNRMCYTDMRMFMVGLNLTYTDRASMAASTEVRVPFIDTEVVKAAFSIPGRDKIRWGTGKWILKKAAEAWLPKDIIYRSKAPFSVPLRAWIRRDLRGVVDELLGEEGLAGRGFINGQVVKRIIDEDRSGKQDHAQRIWQLLTLEIWLRLHERKINEAGAVK